MNSGNIGWQLCPPGAISALAWRGACPKASYDTGLCAYYASVTLTSQTSYNWNTGARTAPVNLTCQWAGKPGGQSVQFQFGGVYAPAAAEGDPIWACKSV
ncbi:MAG: hypothetical protein A49_13520 [Methyloceanibacter sp.]|nr:MAG: hypothetical protein A49_13520 [Methyloceanibacter sp.]